MSQTEAAKHPILIQITAGAPLSSGSFIWMPDSERAFKDALRWYEGDVEYGYRHVAIIRLSVDSIEDEGAVSNWINENFELLARRGIGKVLMKHDRFGNHPSQTETSTKENRSE